MALGSAAIAAAPASPIDIDSVSEQLSPGSPDMDLVSLKICLLGDEGIGKTSFLVRVTALDETKHDCFLMNGRILG